MTSETLGARFTRPALQLYLKLALIGLILLVSLYPLYRIRALIDERQSNSRMVEQEIAGAWGGAQTLVGPVLVLPLAERRSHDRAEAESPGVEGARRFLFVLPDSLRVTSQVEPQVRQRGIYKTVLYRSVADLSGAYTAPDFRALGLDPTRDIRWRDSWIQVGLSDLRGLVDVPSARWNEAALTPRIADPAKAAIIASLPPGLDGSQPWPARFALQVAVNGSRALGFQPLGQRSDISVSSAWPHPSFAGDLLPSELSVGPQGFQADWTLSGLQGSLPRAWLGNGDTTDLLDRGITARHLEVRLIDPVNHYMMSARAVKYGLLFIALVAGVIFVFEAVSSARFHPIQYGMVAAALCLFFLLLLSLSEVIGFAAGYLLAAGLTIALLSTYVAAVFASRRRGALLGGLLALVYGILYLTLRSEDHALLLGTTLLFGALSAAMVATRRLDWYALGSHLAPKTQAETPAHGVDLKESG